MRPRCLLPLVLVVGLIPAGGSAAEPFAMRAVPANPQSPRIDGRIEEEAWAAAPPATEFFQREPRDGAPATERTEARVLYDERALYVAIYAFDSEPDRIVGRLNRRDTPSDSDWLWVELDPQLDHRTGYRFGVNAAGTERDATLYLDTLADPSWDGVWRAAVSRNQDGWSAEFEIPFSTLRLGSSPVWGLNIIRDIARNGERDTWSPAPRSEPGWVSRFGRLEGMGGITAAPRLIVTPYVLARATTGGGEAEGQAEAGTGLRWAGLRGTQVVGAFNPDFGQVELDPAVINLSVFETRRDEKRPFFLEGLAEFETPFELFFSRRIGARPGRLPLAADETLVSKPGNTTILDALRLTARSSAGLRLGLLQALTTEETAEVERTDADGRRSRADRVIEPRAHWLVGRLQQELAGTSSLGLMWTAVHRQGFAPALTGGPDWDLKWAGDRYRLSGQLAFSARDGGQGQDRGIGLKAAFDRTAADRLTGGLSVEATSPDFNPNDAGYLSRSDRVLGRAYATLSWREPDRLTLQRLLSLSASAQSSWRGVSLPPSLSASFQVETTGNWWLGAGVDRGGNGYDDLDSRGGPPVARPSWWGMWLYLTSPGRGSVGLSVDGDWNRDQAGGSAWNASLALALHPADNLELSFGPALGYRHDLAQWLDSRDEDGDGQLDRFYFGELVQHTVDLTLRANWTLTPHLSLQSYLQPFVATGDYRRTLALSRPWSFEFEPADLGYDPDFSAKSLNLNLVLRWEYAPGSTLYVIWTEERFDDSDPGRFDPAADLGDAFTAPGSHAFLVKLEHQLGL